MKDTISISEFRRDIFRVFDLFKNGGSIKVSYRRRVYVFSITATSERVTTPYRRSPADPNNKIPPQSITKGECPECGDLEQNGVCMSLSCPTNTKPAHE